MNKIGLFYATGTHKTASVARKIQQEFGENIVDIIPIENASQKDFEAYSHIIAGSSTWFDGELPSYWDEILPELSTLDLSKKKVAIFGLGDQKGYPDNFADGIGILANEFLSRGAILAGETSPEGYTFNQSQALRNGKFLGLVLDIENQPKQTDERIKGWVKQLKEEFKENKTGPEDSFIC
ncbi:MULTISPECIES: flavodoxin [Parabacteroides]|uniref:flavodoxin n=1 Tax=Parabacteroides provencensis TaxID=1944636 RepID=UPI000C14B4D7|nr:flavodoxin [Parabacteroides provencensis]